MNAAKQVGLFRLSLDDELDRAVDITVTAYRTHNPVKVYCLFSGGNDSLVLLHWVSTRLDGIIDIDGVIHVNTGTGIQATTDFALNTARGWGWGEVHELHPPRSYEEVFIDDRIINGLPGPGMHRVAYARLKERPLRHFVAAQKSHWRDRVMFLTGIRHDESQIRMGYSDSIVDRIGSQVWVNSIYHLDDVHMAEYRQRFNLPKNPVSEHLHLSGECLCGAYARPGELDEIEFFYPDAAERIRGWERKAEAAGLKYCRWGERRPDCDASDRVGPMCRQCVGQMQLLEGT